MFVLFYDDDRVPTFNKWWVKYQIDFDLLLMSLTFNGFNAPTHTQQLHVEHVEHSTNRNKIEKIHFVLTTSIRLLYSIITYIHGVRECVVYSFANLVRARFVSASGLTVPL